MAETWISPYLQGAELEELRRWAEECRSAPGSLPAACETVHTRLIRTVGRGRLASGRLVYVKLMSFPRGKDALRYVHRSLPAEHEARALLRIRQAGIACAEPLYVLAHRRLLRPSLSLLVMQGIETEDRQPSFAELCDLSARLAEIGLFHPDLHPGNFLARSAGGIALIDLQSARWRRAPLTAVLRIRMAAKLWLGSGGGEDPTVMVDSRLIDQGQLPAVLALADRLHISYLRGRVLRCLRTSSEFEARRSWRGTSYRRRVRVEESRLDGGRELRELWIGDRAREVLNGEKPIFTGLFMKSWWLPGANSLYYSRVQGADFLASESSALAAGYRQFQDLGRRLDG